MMTGYLRALTYFVAASLMVLVLLKPAHSANHGPSSKPGWTLAEELKRLATEHKIRIKGLEKTSPFPARPSQGNLQEQLRQLLFDFNYVLIQSPQGEVERVLILSQKEAAPATPKQITLNTGRSGDHHVIEAKIRGTGELGLEIALLVDTGSSFVVLPASMISQLGFTADKLEDREIQTANGQTHAKIGQLRSLEIGPEILHDVKTAFIEDRLLGSTGLLGMNVLGRYLVTIDDQQNRITLIKPD